jgi:hypothetical protein
VAEPEGALEGALHDENPDGGAHVQAWRARTRDSVAPDDSDPLTLTERNRARLEARWGKPIEEPADDPLPGDLDELDWRVVLRGLTVHLHLVRDPLPSMRAVRADYKTGLEEAQQQSASAVAVFRLFGLPGQGLGLVFRFLATCCDRPGRFAGLLFITALLTGSLAWAGLL